MNIPPTPIVMEYLATWLAAAAGLSFVLRARRWTFSARLILVVVCIVVPFVRWNGVSVAGYVLGIYGSISVSAIVLLLIKAASHLTGEKYFSDDERGSTYLMLTIGGLLLYPTSLGLIAFSAYRSAFAAPMFVLMLLTIALVFVFLRLRLPVLVIAVGVGAYQLRLLESLNLWDYLLDPLLFFFSLVLSVKYLIRKVRSRRLARA